ncbi:MAG: hypothetical protein ACKKMV_02865 [Candidatus Nealsonbacteria bacterium]
MSSTTKLLNINLLFILTIISGLFVMTYYLFQVGGLSQDIYLLEDYKIKLATLLENNKSLDINFSKMSSLSNIENYLANRDFVKPTQSQVKYIQILEGSVVTK